KFSGPKLLKLTEERLENLRILFEPVMRIVDFTPKISKKLSMFSDFTTKCLNDIKSRMDNIDPLRGYKEKIISIKASDEVNYAFRISKIMSSLKELVCIIETKRDKKDIGIIQNIMQLESIFYSNKK
ncbi:8243_t:CDS:2, partial [Cetraspora pellucida]